MWGDRNAECDVLLYAQEEIFLYVSAYLQSEVPVLCAGEVLQTIGVWWLMTLHDGGKAGRVSKPLQF